MKYLVMDLTPCPSIIVGYTLCHSINVESLLSLLRKIIATKIAVSDGIAAASQPTGPLIMMDDSSYHLPYQILYIYKYNWIVKYWGLSLDKFNAVFFIQGAQRLIADVVF